MKLLKFRSTSKRLFCAVSLFSFSWIHKWIAYHFVIKEVKNSNGDWSSVHVPSFGHTQPLAFTWKTTQSENSHKRGLQPISSRTTNLCLAKSHICIVRGGGGGGGGHVWVHLGLSEFAYVDTLRKLTPHLVDIYIFFREVHSNKFSIFLWEILWSMCCNGRYQFLYCKFYGTVPIYWEILNFVIENIWHAPSW